MIQKDPKQKLTASAVQLADAVKAKGIIVITKRGVMASFACNCRPKEALIYAFTFEEEVRRQLALLRGVYSYRIVRDENSEQMISQAFSQLLESGQAEEGDQFVVISDLIVNEGVDAIQLRALPKR